MPEGHTIHRAARRLRSILLDRPLVAVDARGPDLKVARTSERLRGATATEIEPYGKNLLIHFDNGYTIYSHLKMDGAWHLYRSGERWRRPRRFAWLALDTGEWQAVNFGGPVLELHRRTDIERDSRLTSLGPDLLKEPFDDAEYLRRMRRNDGRQIGDALMRQQIIAGIGNIYKSETLFLCSLDPWRRVSSLSDDELVTIRETATRIMNDGVLDPRAITYRGPGPAGQWAYMRVGKPCRTCGRPIAAMPQGDDQRTTYWCTHCQV